MTEFEKVLQECLEALEEGTASVEECLNRHPEHAAQLRPVLLAGTSLVRVGAVPVPDEFKARVRARVMREVYAHPRRPMRSASLFVRLSIGLAAALLALVATGTAYAQGTLPGSAFYGWKLASEGAWRAISYDPVGIDLKIAARRADELIAVNGNPSLYPQALKTYLQTADRLKSEMNVGNKARIMPLLDSQTRRLSRSGITLPIHDLDAVPTNTNEPTPTLLPVSPTPQPYSTILPREIPTSVASPVPSVSAPPIQAPPKIVPTLHSPPAVAPTTKANFP